MTFSRELYQSAISRNEKIGTREVSYYRQRMKNGVFSRLIGAFADRAERYGVTKSKLATLTGKDPAIINRILSLPSNMTLETISDLALALGFEPEITFQSLDESAGHNFVHPWMLKYADTSAHPATGGFVTATGSSGKFYAPQVLQAKAMAA